MAQCAFCAAQKVDSSILKVGAWYHRSDALSSIVIVFGMAVVNIFGGPMPF
jgi:divalent metal cation (Fe/Co/Zn/Cd) transporter